jgi:hypothetical protein
MQQKGPPIKLPKASTQTPTKTNLLRNFNSNVKNPNLVVSKIRNAKMFSILEEIGQRLESRHTLTLGQLFKISFDLKQYVVAKLFLGKKNIHDRTKSNYGFGGNRSSHGYDISPGWQKHYQRHLTRWRFGINIMTKELRK